MREAPETAEACRGARRLRRRAYRYDVEIDDANSEQH